MSEPNGNAQGSFQEEWRVQRWLDQMDARERHWADQYALMARLLPFAEADGFTFLDVGAGTGAVSRTILTFYPNSSAVLADYSPQIMGRGAEMMAAFEGRHRYVEFDLREMHWPEAIPVRLDAAVSAQCFHHIPDVRKRTLFREIRERLVPGGWFLNLDPIRVEDPAVAAECQRVGVLLEPPSSHRRTPRTPEERAAREDHERNLCRLEPQLGFLREAGFEAIDVYWKRLDFVIYGGRRPTE